MTQAVTTPDGLDAVGAPDEPIRTGRVVEADGARALVELRDVRVWADPAMPMRYLPTPGDELLIAREGERFWIIGVIAGVGSVELESVGDVSVRSLGGTLTLGGTEAVEVQAGRYRLFADSVETVARAVRQSLGSLVQAVRGRRLVQAGSDYRIIEGVSFQRSQRMHSVSKEESRIDGSTVHFG